MNGVREKGCQTRIFVKRASNISGEVTGCADTNFERNLVIFFTNRLLEKTIELYIRHLQEDTLRLST